MAVDRRVVALVAGDLFLAAAAPAANTWFNWVVLQADVCLQVGAAVVAVWTFFMVWVIQRDPVNRAVEASSNPIRDAVAAAFVVSYLVMVGWSAFFGLFYADDTRTLGPISQAFVSNYTFLTGLVVGSYFGADAIKQVAVIRSRRSSSNDNDDHAAGKDGPTSDAIRSGASPTGDG